MKISVYITSYNHQAYLVESVESVLKQTLRPHEIIIVDDASTDDSQLVIAGYTSRYPGWVKGIYHTRNQGVAVVRNQALTAASGDYITYVDGDDRFLPRKLEDEAERLQDSSADLVYSPVRIIDPRGQLIETWGVGNPLPEGDIFEQVFSRRFPRRMLFRSELVNLHAWRQTGLYDPRLTVYEDYDMRVRLARQLRAAACTNALSEHRRHPGGLSRRPAQEFLEAFTYLRNKNQPLLAGQPPESRARVNQALDKWQARLMRRVALEMTDRQSAWKVFQESRKLDPGLDAWFLSQFFLPDGLTEWLKRQRWRLRQRWLESKE